MKVKHQNKHPEKKNVPKTNKQKKAVKVPPQDNSSN